MRATRNYVLVRISKAEKDKKLKTPGGILIAPEFEYMMYNLQMGRVMSLGATAKDNFPEMEVGDTAIFHHTIEDGDERLVQKLPNGDEIRYVDGSNQNGNYEMLAVLKGQDDLIPSPQFMFVSPSLRPMKEELKANFLKKRVDSEMWLEDDYLMEKIKDYEMEIAQKMQTIQPYHDNPGLLAQMEDKEFYKLEESSNAIISIKQEMAEVSKKLRASKIHSSAVTLMNEATSKELPIKEGDRIIFDKDLLYPVDIDGVKCLLLNKNYVWVNSGQ